MTIIDDKYNALLAAGLDLGPPITPETSLPGGGAYRDYAHVHGTASIYYHPAVGAAYEVHGAIWGLWASLGRETSLLGYPTSDEQDTPHHTGRVSHFQNGAIYWDPGRGAYEVFPRPAYPACDPATLGQWDTPTYNSGVVGMHAALLHTNQLLFFAYREPIDPENPGPIPPDYGECAVLDLSTNTISHPSYHGISGSTEMLNIFCSGHAFLPDGRLLVAGGDRESQTRVRSLHLFTPDGSTGGSWQYIEQFASGRWYASCITLPNGHVLTVAGEKRISGIETRNTSYQIFNPISGHLEAEVSAPPLSGFGATISYPFLFVLPSGKLMMHGGTRTVFLDLHTWSFDSLTLEAASRPGRNARTYGLEGTSVLLPLLPTSTPPYRARVMMIGGGGPDPVSIRTPATNTCEILDTSVSPMSWQLVASMAQPRVMPDAVLLPDGNVLVMNGSSRGHADNGANPVWEAELYNPVMNTWTTLCAMNVPRLYHATALLLPDARVMTAGTDSVWNPDPFHEAELRLEIFSPPYLFHGARPTIIHAPDSFTYNSEFNVQTPNAAQITAVALIRCGSSTHSFNPDQRYIGLSILSRTGNNLRLKAPPNDLIAPPGYYMLFLLRDGIPSVARFIKLDHIRIPRPPILYKLWPPHWIRDPRTGIPIPLPIDPDHCPACWFFLIRNGWITDVQVDPTGRVTSISIDKGEARAFDLTGKEIKMRLPVKRLEKQGMFNDSSAFQNILKEGAKIKGLLLEEGQLQAIIAGTGKFPIRLGAKKLPRAAIQAKKAKKK